MTEGGIPLSAEIVTTGTEILLGEIVDTNAAWIAQQLRDAGVNLYYKTTVGDNLARVTGVISLCMSRSDVIIVSGGIGPTKDDITRQAIADATGRPLVMHPGALETLKARFARFGSQMTENNLQQAMIPTGATLIENPVGTAPGFIVETDTGTVIAVPGVPREMKHLMLETVLPYLRERAANQGIIRRRVLRTIGIGESAIDDRLSDFMQWANPTVGLAAQTGQCDVRITARADSASEADVMLDALEAAVRERIGDFIYSSVPEEPFAAVVARQLQLVHANIAILESNTGGNLAARLAESTAADPVVALAIAVNTDEVPEAVAAQLVVSKSDEYTDAMAARAAAALRANTGATYALALLGTQGEQEGVYGTASGRTWIGISTPSGSQAILCGYGGQDEYTITLIGNNALRLLWQELKR
ncbi:MAG: CinA family nicotinamide mononucleotide deamidase-related protein [Caldilineaceae bacterium]|nr:CinA family nicotinamide mononucleotide deamidase-related protein [Caldilineaceae bacterium]